ncbi:MAG: MoxR family ATPase [Clostridia bacterium]|nr:MoxR family ATPase [Clostridia bacterium]
MNEDIKYADVPSMTVTRAVDTLSGAYAQVVKKGIIKTFPSVMLWGAPGVGKSQAVRQIASKIEESTGKTVCITDVRLLLFNPIDLRGIPTANEDKTLAVWLRPKIFQMDESADVVNILFLDEITSAPQSVQAAGYQITLDRTVGEHKLPDNCIVIAAGNRVTDKSVAYRMPKALANRLLHITIETDFSSWREWAVKKAINYKVIGFLSFRPDHLSRFNPGAEDMAFATPRAWERVSDVLNSIDADMDTLYPLIAGLIGNGMAAEFRTWCEIYSDLPNTEDIFKGKSPKAPTRPDALYALTSAMTSYARDHRNSLREIAASISYADSHFPADYSVLLLKDYMSFDQDYKKKLMSVPEFMRWYREKGRLLNGTV